MKVKPNPFSICNWTFEILLSRYDKMLKETVTSFFYKHAFGTKNILKSQYSTVQISMEEFSYSGTVCLVLTNNIQIALNLFLFLNCSNFSFLTRLVSKKKKKNILPTTQNYLGMIKHCQESTH